MIIHFWVSPKATAAKLAGLRAVGVPYEDADIEGAKAAVAGQTEMAALIAYLQQLGTVRQRGAAQ